MIKILLNFLYKAFVFMWTHKEVPIDTLSASETKYGSVRGIVERPKVWEESRDY